ncbi:MAG: flagellar biosynthetic protein FliQ [Bryobacterales bacterium]|nr:flagellar biosynthetic protein FliQ [Bryobacterales bacterium]
MNVQTTTEILRHALLSAFWIALPLLLVGFVVGIVTSLVQIVTSLQDPSFAAVPRIGAFLVAVIVLLPWMTLKMVGYTVSILGDLGRYAR